MDAETCPEHDRMREIARGPCRHPTGETMTGVPPSVAAQAEQAWADEPDGAVL